MSLEEIEEQQRAKRLHQLYRCGLGNFRDVMYSMDALKRELSPKTTSELRHLSQRDALAKSLSDLQQQNTLVKLAVKQGKDGQLQVGLLLPDTKLVEYCINVDLQEDIDDPLGMRSLFGTLKSYGATALFLFLSGDQRPRGQINLKQERYDRDFRLVDSSHNQLRKFIDIALWTSDHVFLSPQLADLYSQINGDRYHFLTDMGLIAVPDENSDLFELYMPGSQARNIIVSTDYLQQLANQFVRRMAFSPNGYQFVLDPQGSSAEDRRFFRLVREKRLHKSDEFRTILKDFGLYMESPDGSERAFVVTNRPGHGASGSPSLTTTLASSSASSRVAAASSPAATSSLTDDQMPRGFSVFIEGALLNGRKQFIPNTREYCKFLMHADAPNFLRKKGVAVFIPKSRRDGTFEQAAYLYTGDLPPDLAKERPVRR